MLEHRSRREVELKFPVADSGKIRARLLEAGFVTRGEVFEHNVVFDTPQGVLATSGRLLRLRRDRSVTLTFKELPRDRESRDLASRFKVRSECETTVGDFESMRYVLRSLGFTEERVYEKYREHFVRGDRVHAELDRLPHLGIFLELEAEPEEIESVCAELGLDLAGGLRENYFQLFDAARQRLGLDTVHMCFADTDQR